MRGSVLTSRVTGTVIGEFEAPVAEMLICPVQVPAAKPEVFTCTLKVLGVAPLFWFRTSQLPQLVSWAVAVKLTFAPVLLLRVRACASGKAVQS
jgi:hypothetical protein